MTSCCVLWRQLSCCRRTPSRRIRKMFSRGGEKVSFTPSEMPAWDNISRGPCSARCHKREPPLRLGAPITTPTGLPQARLDEPGNLRRSTGGPLRRVPPTAQLREPPPSPPNSPMSNVRPRLATDKIWATSDPGDDFGAVQPLRRCAIARFTQEALEVDSLERRFRQK